MTKGRIQVHAVYWLLPKLNLGKGKAVRVLVRLRNEKRSWQVVKKDGINTALVGVGVLITLGSFKP
jgi:hypothetical protein